MNVSFKITNVTGFPEFAGQQNVVATIYWEATFEEGGGTSLGGGMTRLDIDAISQDSFTPIDQLTEQQLIDWVIAVEGGDEWLNAMKDIHQTICEQDAFQKSQSSLGLSFQTYPAEVNVTPVVLEPIK